MGAASPAISFVGRNEAAQRVAARRAAQLVREITEQTRAALRAIIVRSIEEGVSPLDTARAIRPMIGLTAAQANSAWDYRVQLLNSGLPLARVDTLSDRYTAKKIRERADTIARTEVLQSLNAGAMESAREAQAEGLLGLAPMKSWIVTEDASLCPSCEAMSDVTVPLDEPFETPDGPVDAPPLHPRCRCAVVTVAA